MSTSAETNSKQSKQSGQAMSATNDSTIDMIRRWKKDELLKWIQQKLSIPLEPQDAEKLSNANIHGVVFLKGAGNEDFFLKAGLSFGASVQLAELARETVGKKKSECCRSTSYADKRHRLYHARHADVHCPRWLRHTATPDICTLHFHFYSS